LSGRGLGGGDGLRGLTGLYAIADAATLRRQGMGLREFAEELRAGGVGTAGASVVQWRCKGGSRMEVLEGAAVLREVFVGMGCRLLMNDSAELAVAAGFDGVHVGQGDGWVEEARRIVGADGIVGVSTHTEAEVRAADASSADYVAVGPVFRTGTKVDAAAVVGLEGVRRARALTPKPLVGIGGISAGNAREVIEAGADAVAVIGALYRAGRSVEKSAGELLQALAKQV